MKKMNENEVKKETEKEIEKVTIRLLRISAVSLLLGRGPSIKSGSEILVYWRINGKERTVYLGVTSQVVDKAVEMIKRSRELPSGLQWWGLINELKKQGWISKETDETVVPVLSIIGAITLTSRYTPWRVVRGPVNKLIKAIINCDKETIEKVRKMMDDKRVKKAIKRLEEGRLEDKEVMNELKKVLEQLGKETTLDNFLKD